MSSNPLKVRKSRKFYIEDEEIILKIIEIGEKEFEDVPNLYYTYWSPTNVCNYNCDYCSARPYYRDKFIPLDDKLKIIDFINYISKKYNNVVSLYGGEASIDPDIFKIVHSLTNPYRIKFYTNLSLNIQFYKSIQTINDRILFTVSYHHLKTNSIEFISKVEFLSRFGRIRAKVMWDSRYKYEILEVYEKLKEIENDNCFVELNLIYETDKTNEASKWTKEDLDLFLSCQTEKSIYVIYGIGKQQIKTYLSFNEIWLKHLENNFPYLCKVGEKSLYIESNGDVYYCKNSLYNPHSPLFNCIKDNFNDNLGIFKTNVTCKGFCCEVSIPKRLKGEI